MVNWFRYQSALLLKASFLVGALCAIAIAIFGAHTPQNLMSIGIRVCIFALLGTFLSRAAIWCAKRFMPDQQAPQGLLELPMDQFHALGASVRFALFAGLLGLCLAAFGFGWLLSTMAAIIYLGK